MPAAPPLQWSWIVLKTAYLQTRPALYLLLTLFLLTLPLRITTLQSSTCQSLYFMMNHAYWVLVRLSQVLLQTLLRYSDLLLSPIVVVSNLFLRCCCPAGKFKSSLQACRATLQSWRIQLSRRTCHARLEIMFLLTPPYLAPPHTALLILAAAL